MSDAQTFLLNRFQFCHVLDQNSGLLSLHEGPKRIQLESHQSLVHGVQDRVRVFDGQFAVVLNPFNSAKNDIQQGEREVRVGPTVFSLYPGEILENKIRNEYVLTVEDALLLRAEKDVPNPLKPEELIPAGTEVLLKGPRKYIPHKDIKVVEERKSISLAEAEGLYIQNDDTGVVRLVEGPADFFLEQNESTWDKRLTNEELDALGYGTEDSDDGARSLSAEPRERAADYTAVVVDLEDKEVIYLYDNERVRVEFGPKTVFLGPNERPKVLHLSGDVPIKPKALRVAKLNLGPDFIRDRLTVRTQDNATLQLSVNYRWVFEVEAGKHQRLFALKDFIGFTAQTLSSEIREVAAKSKFEDFHAKAAELVKAAIFGQSDKRVFTENGLVVFGVDVEGITPEDNEIKKKLADAIKTNVDIYTRRVQEEAQLESERRLIDGRVKNEQALSKLIKLEVTNERQRQVEAAKTFSEAIKEKATGEAKATRIKAEAELEGEEKKLKAVTSILNGAGGKEYLELERARVLKATDKVIVPTDSKLVLGVDRLIE